MRRKLKKADNIHSSSIVTINGIGATNTCIKIYARDMDTGITVKGPTFQDLSQPLVTTKNKMVLNGRIFSNENVSGKNLPSNQHLTLNTIYNVPHSINCFAENVMDSRGAVVDKLSNTRSCAFVMLGNGADNPATPNTPYEANNHNTMLYGAIPWIYRPKTEDINETERANYRLRAIVIDQLTGSEYVAYYAKKIETVELKMLENGASDYIPTMEDSNPNTEENAKKITIESIYKFSIEKSECTEWFTATQSNKKFFNEFGLILAKDLPNTLEAGKLELASAELLSHVVNDNMPLTQTSFDIEYNIFS